MHAQEDYNNLRDYILFLEQRKEDLGMKKRDSHERYAVARRLVGLSVSDTVESGPEERNA
jgi:hypothetical protein